MSRYDNLINNLGKSNIVCTNLGIGEIGATLSNLNRAVAICPDLETVHNLSLQLNALNKKNTSILNFEKPFTISTFSSREFAEELIRSLFLLSSGDGIILTTANICNSIIPKLENFKNSIINLTKNEDYDIKKLESELSLIGYKKVDSVTARGEFAVRGDILDVFNIVDENPTRLDFFDTTLENIHSFDFLSFEKLKTVESLQIAPNKLLLSDEISKDEILSQFEKLKLDDEIVFDIISTLEREEDLPLEFVAFSTAFNNFLDLDIPIVVLNKIQFENNLKKSHNQLLERIDNAFKCEKLKNLYKTNEKFIDFDHFFEHFDKNLIFFEKSSNYSTDLKNKFKTPSININFETKQFESYLLNLNKLYSDLKPYLNKKIYLCLSQTSTYNSIKTIFEKNQIPFTTNKNGKGLILTELNIPYNICFLDSDSFYIGSTNFAHQKSTESKTKTKVKYLPKAGEYVVHSVHGIGKCEGVVSMKVEGVEKEFFHLTYRGGALYVPCENADCLSLYMANGENVTLNKLGGKEFSQLKLKASKAIEDMSKELLELYAKRKASKGYKYSEDDYLFTEFETAFKNEETPDQLQAIADVKKDMTSGKVMDRLICGDVGFGKTEVAMRAMFKAVEDGKQVAFLAPTTILSLQHFKTVSERTKDFGVRVEMLNRFRSKKEQSEIIDKLKTHQIDVVCGTHRLVSEDVNFADLGLLILDEEQRFGVKAKEKIKGLKNNVDVLTLSATPIPRTLSMSLMNVRDISIINTPPVNRLPVKTYVLEFDMQQIAGAINEELKRDGQVLVVYNDIVKIYAFKDNLLYAVNNSKANFDVAHGRMGENELERAISRLYNRETNVLVSTTLIENGVDLPKANTLIVIDSDKLGLSQMYQLRGRVGRSEEQAYAYFTYPKNKVLTEEASNRLQAIAENTELGSGFKIAMRDLQIRGAGELLGKVQHGHMVKIGYEMYSKLLNDTIKRLQGENVEVEREVKIEIALSSYIPKDFIEDESERLKIISKISCIQTKEEAKKVLNELIVEYGKLPKEVYQLSQVALIRSLAIKQNIRQIILNNRVMQISYYEDANLDEIIKKVNKFSQFKFLKSKYPTIVLDPHNTSVPGAQNYLIEFLNN